MNLRPNTRQAKLAIVPMDRAPGREVVRQRSPGTAGTADVQDPVEDLPHVHAAGAAAGLRRWDQGFQELPLLLRQVTRIWRPFHILLIGQTPTQSSLLTHALREIQTPKALEVSITDDTLTVDLVDGRTLSIPLAWYPRLLHGTPEERRNWRLIGDGLGIHWPDLDEDISIEGLRLGKRSGASQRSLQRWLESRAKSDKNK